MEKNETMVLPELDKIVIKNTKNADTRTCNFRSVSKEQLLANSKLHIKDVKAGLTALSDLLLYAAEHHDKTKITGIDQFHEDFKTGFHKVKWWNRHQLVERHHFKDPGLIQDDVNLIDILEQLVDGVMAGMARSGKYTPEVPSTALFVKAYNNTAQMLKEAIEIEELVEHEENDAALTTGTEAESEGEEGIALSAREEAILNGDVPEEEMTDEEKEFLALNTNESSSSSDE